LGKKYILEHLNNNRKDNRLENFTLAHQHCNIIKAHNTDYDLIAQQKLKDRLKRNHQINYKGYKITEFEGITT